MHDFGVFGRDYDPLELMRSVLIRYLFTSRVQ